MHNRQIRTNDSHVQDELREKPADRIAFLAEKYGVSKAAVMMAISLGGGDDALVEKILQQNRFVR